MANTPAFQYYPADLFSDPDVMFWDMEMLGCYWQMITYLWLNGGLMESKPELIRDLFRTKRRDKAEKMWSKIKVKFQINDGIITHKRVLEEMQKQTEWRLKSSLGGKKSAKIRAEKSKGGCEVVENITQPKGNSSSSSSSSSPINKKPIILFFEKFWEAWPSGHKVGRGKAEESFAKINPDDELLSKMILAVGAAKKSKQWKKDGGDFIPMPVTWLNQKRWLDELKPAITHSQVITAKCPGCGGHTTTDLNGKPNLCHICSRKKVKVAK